MKLPQNFPSLWHATLYLPVIFWALLKKGPFLPPALHSHQSTVIFYHHLVSNTDIWEPKCSGVLKRGYAFLSFMALLPTGNKDTSVASKQAPEFIQVNFHLRPMKSSLPTSISWLCWVSKAKLLIVKSWPVITKSIFPHALFLGCLLLCLWSATTSDHSTNNI